MQTFHHGAVAEIPNTSRGVYAFAVNGHVDDDTSEALAKYMNDVFDRQEKVHMLFDLSGYSGSDGDALLDGDVLKSRLRSLSHVGRYAVVGAPENAERMIRVMDKIIPVEAKAFPTDSVDKAWAFVGAQPSGQY